ncbi:Predicted arabinose efflux permease, MFS family [Actinacidiphila yanglinensis]|uniref:Predicted arabinose efflux permease, MFS family n=1 Tax=Actinacidiphila yanglinensis TaxID=310779 RepID=A0A1H6CIY6_9ACTN|nr:MFS transporter [Actinacidiphila yanglinensis]SEG72892.1 Predicted arabinose efflux permease, MFS family [Actinacidiphila yanglinensis]
MAGGRTLGRRFGWLWASFAVSSYGTWLGYGAFPLIAVLVLHSGPAQVAALAAVGRAVGAVLAVPLGPWLEFRHKRPVMVAMDLIRCAALASVPAAYALDRLGFAQLLAVSVVVSAANIAFTSAGGAYLNALVPAEDLIVANGRFETTMWTSSVVGPPLGGAAIGMFGPLTTVLADSASYLLSALGLRAIGGTEPHPGPAGARRLRAGDLLEGWRHILGHPVLRPLFLNALTVNGLIMVSEPLLAVLLLGHFGFAPWQYGLAFALPCTGGLIGSRAARPLAARFGQHRVMVAAGALRACWPIGLAFVGPGVPGIVLIVVVQFGLVTCCGVFNPLLATYRLTLTDPDRVVRTLSAWSVSSSAIIAAMTAVWGLLADLTGPRAAVALAGVLLLGTPLLLPRGGVPRPAGVGGSGS